MTDLVTFGASQLRLTPPADDRLETATDLACHVGGPESTVAATAAQLGVTSSWLSKLPETPLGRRIERGVRTHGVETAVAWTEEGRVGTRYHERGGEPRGTTTLVDREDAAIRTASPGELAVDRIRDADAFYTTGATAALSPTVADTTVELLETASEAATVTVFDLAHDRAPWDADAAGEVLADVLPNVDILFLSEAAAASVLDRAMEPASIGAQLIAEHDHGTVVIDRGEHGAVAVSGGEAREQRPIPSETVDAVGAADAHVGAFLARQLQGGSLAEGLAWGAAVAALTRTVGGDVPVVTPAEVRAVLAEAEAADRHR